MESYYILLLATVFIFIFICSAAGQTDPCTSYEPLPRAEYRGGQCDYVQDKAVCDVYLNDDTWYRAEGLNGDLTMQESAADFMKCGTKFPLWMNGTHPAIADGEVDRQACQTNLYSFCSNSVTIKVKNCGSFFVYKMPSTSSCPEGYCFGENDVCPPFDPCDYYENTELPHDASRSTSCVVSDMSTCDNLGSDTWYKFAGETINNYLTVATSCPTSTTCGTESQLWIIDGISADNANGTRTSYVCAKRGDACCAEIFALQSKQCDAGFTVYHFNKDLTGDCHGFCTDDTSATCPPASQPTTTTVTTVTDPPWNQDDENELNYVHPGWLVLAFFSGLLTCAVIVTFIYAVVPRAKVGWISRRFRISDSTPNVNGTIPNGYNSTAEKNGIPPTSTCVDTYPSRPPTATSLGNVTLF